MKHDLTIITIDGKYLRTTVDGYNINDIILSTSKGVDLKVLNKTTLRY